MKKTLYILACSLGLGLSSCQSYFLDLDPLDEMTDAVYFKEASDFNEYAISFYGQLLGWNSKYGSIYNYFDGSTDLSTYFNYQSEVGRGTIQVTTDDTRWNNCYSNIRTVNILLEKAKSYPGDSQDISRYVSEAYFFRAYSYFYLLKFFGGVPKVTTVLDIDSPELMGKRNSRYEIFSLILEDLDKAIEGLPLEQSIPADEKGRISQYAAKAFKARVLLYEATWRKYNGTTTDYEGSEGPESDQVNEFLAEAEQLSYDVIVNGKYSLWNYNSQSSMQNMSSRYLFCLEEADSNPAGMTKASNNEFIIYSVYDASLRPGGINLNQTVPKMDVSRKFIDMFVCTDGLPIEKSAKFQGYATPSSEFANRDYRLKSYIYQPADDKILNDGRSGYVSAKFYCEGKTNLNESPNYPVLRLAEVYLIYAEAIYELRGEITDQELERSINQLRKRAGVANLTNALVADNGLDMKEEIRRERTVELYMEGYRFDDLKRWGIMEQELNESRLGMVVGSDDYDTTFMTDGENTSNFAENTYVWGTEETDTPKGKLKCVAIDVKTNFNVTKTHYLWPIPQKQINLNGNLKQNPGY